MGERRIRAFQRVVYLYWVIGRVCISYTSQQRFYIPGQRLGMDDGDIAWLVSVF